MTSDPILHTKFFIPPFREDYISRPRLVSKIDQGTRKKLVALIAPAGYGKSTALSEWTSTSNMPAAWLSLDNGHNDPLTFCQYLIVCLQSILPEFGESILYTLNSPNPPQVNSLTTFLINDIASQPEHIALILDDFHHISNAGVLQVFDTLLNSQPSQLHLFIASRSELPFPTSRLRVQGEMAVLGIDDIRFSQDEISSYLQARLGSRLTTFQEQVVGDQSEGWITGLHLAVLSFQNSPDGSNSVENFTGEDRYITEYLMDEVLSRQSEEVYRFLLRSSILDKLSGPLCSHITGVKNSQEIIEYLDKSGLFTIPLDNNQTWYRYHHLFAELLLHRFKSKFPEEVAGRHKKAAEWYFENGMMEEAVEHSLNAKDYNTVLEYLVSICDDILAKGKFTLYLSWLDRIPEEYLVEYPKLILNRIFQLWEMANVEKFRQQLEFAADILGELPQDISTLDAGMAPYHGILLVIKGIYQCGNYNHAEAVGYLTGALKLLPDNLPFWRGLSLGATGFCHRLQGDFYKASKFFYQAEMLAIKSDLTFIYFMYSIAQISVSYASAQLNEAIFNCRRLIDMDENQKFGIPFSGLAYTIMGELVFQTGELAKASTYIKRGLALVMRDGDVYATARAFFALARVYVAMGDPDEALKTTDRMMSQLHRMNTPYATMIIARAYQAFIWIETDHPSLAKKWVQHTGIEQLQPDEFPEVLGQSYYGMYCTVNEPMSFYIDTIKVVQAKYEMKYGDRQQYTVLSQELKSSETYQRQKQFSLLVMVMDAIQLSGDGKKEEAISLLLECIRQVFPEPYYSMFLCEGKPMFRLLVDSAEFLRTAPMDDVERKQLHGFIERLLEMAQDVPRYSVAAGNELKEELSGRELDVLNMLALGITYQEAASRMVLSQNTIKTHIKRIYAKLQVNNRLQAINRAEELGLISKSR